MARYGNAHPDLVEWDRTNPCVPFINNVMQGDVYKWSKNVEWRHVPQRFKAAMEIVGYEPTNSSYAVQIKSAVDGTTYRMPVRDLFDILEQSQVIQDQIPEHEYKFSKQGSTYIVKVML